MLTTSSSGPLEAATIPRTSSACVPRITCTECTMGGSGSAAWRPTDSYGNSAREGSAPCELEMRDLRSGHGAHELEPVQIVPEPFEQPLAAAEQRRHEVDLHLVHQARRQILAGRVRSACQRYVLASCCPPRLFERRLHSARDERERRSTLECQRLPRVMRKNEHGVMERRVDSPPTVPWLLGPPGARMTSEHVAPHHRGSDVRERLLDHLGARVHRSSFEPMHGAPGGERKGPFVQTHSADPERIVDALAGTGDEAVERHRDPEAQL